MNERRSWRVLRLFRPVLLGVAAATAWLALSTTAASADTCEDHSSLLSLNSKVASVVGPAPKPDPGAEAHGLSRLILDVVSGTADQTAAVLPLAGDAVPPDITTSLVPPAVALENSTFAVVAAAVTRVNSSIASVALPDVPAVIADAPVAVAVQPESTPGVTAIAPTFDHAADVLTDSPRLEGESLAGPAPGASPGVPAALPTSFPLAHSGFGPPAAAEAPVPTDADAPAHPLGDPDALSAPAGSGAGSQTQPGGSGPAPLVARSFQLNALTDTGPISGPLQHAPNPVSFDPGSSPD